MRRSLFCTLSVHVLTAMLIVSLAASLAACGGDDGGAPPTEASATIGAAGGTLDGPDGARVVIPPGALAQDTRITIARRDTGAPAAGPDGYTPRGATYEFTPHDIVFAQPVTMRVPVPPSAAANDEGVFRAGLGSSIWEAIGQTAAGGFAEWQSSGFSWYAHWGCAYTGTPADPYPCVGTSGFTQITPTPSNALALITHSAQAAYRYFGVTQATTLQLVASYSAPADCGDARIAFKRRRAGQSQPEVLLDTVPTVSTSGSRIHATAPFTVALTDADNGSTMIITAFSCRRAYQSPSRVNLSPSQQRTGAHDTMVFNAQIPAPPATVAPQVTLQPVAQSVTAPAAASFSAGASGAPAPTVQWQRSNDNGATWSDVAGATSLSYTLAATTVGDHGALFRAVFNNSAGTAASQGAALAVAAPPTTAGTHVGKLSLGFKHSCAVTSDGRLACWGYNSSLQIGQPNPQSASYPTPMIVPLAGTVTSVAAGHNATCAIHGGGLLSCWGSLGGTNVPTSTGLGDVTQMAFGFAHRCFVAEGHVACAGDNSAGQLGQGTLGVGSATALSVPDAAAAGTQVIALAAGTSHTCALSNAGEVRCWGRINGQSDAQGNAVLTPSPTVVVGLPSAVEIGAGNAHTCAVAAGGSVWCWGANAAGQQGTGSTSSAFTTAAAQVAGVGNVIALGAGADQTCVVQSDGRVRCWGAGQMGNGNAATTQPTPSLVSGLTGARTVSVASGQHVCVLTTARGAKCWGANADAQLGTTDLVGRTTPTDVSGTLQFWWGP